MKITIGSRGSDLALWQANFVTDALEKLGHTVTLKIIITKGDKIQDLSFDKIEGKGFFTKEIEDALLNNEIDLAVHSHKDLETSQPDGLMIGAVSYRENPTDQLLILKSSVEEGAVLELKENPIVGTSSARRKSQMMRIRPDAKLKDLRGNVPTRINKLRAGDYDAIILATAGIKRLDLDLSDLHCIELDPHEFVPAPAQGVLGLQIRSNDTELSTVMAELNHQDVAAAIGVERKVLQLLAGGCQLPLGVYAEENHKNWNIHVSYAPDQTSAANVTVYDTYELAGMAEQIVEDLTRVND
jgi:hydroxymethylbilane synthase